MLNEYKYTSRRDASFTPIHLHTSVYWTGGRGKDIAGTGRKEEASAHRYVNSPIHNLKKKFVKVNKIRLGTMKKHARNETFHR